MKAIIVLPTYNEKDNIENMINTVLNLPEYIEILVVDDNSPDGTATIVEKYLNNDRVHLLKRDKKEGLGPAYIAGFKHSFQYDPDYIIEMDADFSHDPNFVVKFIERIEKEKLDLVIGSRYCNGISVVNWPLRRLFLSYYGNRYAAFILGSKIMDITGGFKCFRASVLKKMNFDNIISAGYSFQIEMNYSFESNGYKIKEEPIIFYERRSGQSKMSKNIIAEALLRVVRLRFRNKKKYFNG
ncbi:polyprenol monophosphomannose synthase [Brachyspira murdochii]|uniref:polyprenol monophosphomannose synthase n=1 Tax=Brachyspira murdochii TaxID=84378 RepID=UPI0030056A1D